MPCSNLSVPSSFPAEAIIENPKDPYTRALMKAAFEIEADETGVVAR